MGWSPVVSNSSGNSLVAIEEVPSGVLRTFSSYFMPFHRFGVITWEGCFIFRKGWRLVNSAVCSPSMVSSIIYSCWSGVCNVLSTLKKLEVINPRSNDFFLILILLFFFSFYTIFYTVGYILLSFDLSRMLTKRRDFPLLRVVIPSFIMLLLL
jgi:hypothetical protein